jgi:hypothetical protein
VRNIWIAALVGLLLGTHRPDTAMREVICSCASNEASADLRFFVELVERANDRLLNDIRAFNAIAYMLLGPLLAIAAFVDYHDLRNMVPLSFVAFSTVMTFAALLLRRRNSYPQSGQR